MENGWKMGEKEKKETVEKPRNREETNGTGIFETAIFARRNRG